MKGERDMIEKALLRKRLIDDFDCKESQVDDIVGKIEKLAPHIAAAFEKWFRTGIVEEIEVEGYSVASLRAIRKNMNVVGAYLTLDFLSREPERAKQALTQQEFENSAVLRFTGRK